MNVVRTLRALFLAATVATSAVGAAAPPVAAASFCQCVTYVQNYIGYLGVYYAKDAGPVLKRWGYRDSGSPMGVNDVVVMQPGFAVANSTAGHIGFLAGWSVSNGRVTVTLRGANQPGSWWTDHNCTNVSRWTFSYTSNWGIHFYRR